MHHVLNPILNDLLMQFPSPPKCGLLEAGFIECLLGPGTLLGTQDNRGEAVTEGSSETWVALAASKVWKVRHVKHDHKTRLPKGNRVIPPVSSEPAVWQEPSKC